MNKKFIVLISLLSALTIGVVSYNKLTSKFANKTDDATEVGVVGDSDDTDIGVVVHTVEVSEARKGASKKQIKVTGTLKGVDDVVIKSEIDSKIKSVKFTEGTVVKKGQELIIFEDAAYMANYNKTKAEYDIAKAAANTAKRLLDHNAGTRKDYDDATSKLNAAKAAMDSAEYELSKTTITAPFSGMIGIMKENVGNIVQRHTELVSIVDTSSMVVNFEIPVAYIQNISVGQFVDVMVDAYRGDVFCGTVGAIDAVVDEKNNSIMLKAIIPNEDGKLRHGMFSTVLLTVGAKENAVIVPTDSILKDGANEYVWVINRNDNTAYRKIVKTGAVEKNEVEIVSGVKFGDLVVTAGYNSLSFVGEKVKIIKTKIKRCD